MRGKLQALIDYTGLSIGEAAHVCGIGHDALGRKLAGRPRYDVNEGEIAALQKVADWQDAQVRAILDRVERLSAERGRPPQDICMVQYRKDEDMLDRNGPPASAQRMIIARLMRESAAQIRPVVFDSAAYHSWRGDRGDTHALRGEWAAATAIDYRIGMKLGGSTGRPVDHSGDAMIGLAVVQIGRAAAVIDAGTDRL